MKHVIQCHGNLNFHSCHPILDDIAKTLSNYDFNRLPCKEVNIYVGVHSFKRSYLPKGLNVGIQTEQYFDANGMTLWGHATRLKILRQVSQYKMTFDLSPANRPAYDFLPHFLRKKVIFGPHIFPDQDVLFQPSTQALVFFGSVNLRRRNILDALSKRQNVTIVDNNIFGEKLTPILQESFAILNLHYKDGVYTEIPRLLTAYLQGKPIVSEELALPLIEGRHYFPLDAKFNVTTASEVFENFKQEFVVKHRISNLLDQVDRDFSIF